MKLFSKTRIYDMHMYRIHQILHKKSENDDFCIFLLKLGKFQFYVRSDLENLHKIDHCVLDWFVVAKA